MVEKRDHEKRGRKQVEEDPRVVRHQEIAGILAVVAALLWLGGAFYLAKQQINCEIVFGRGCVANPEQQAHRDTVKLVTRGAAIICLSVAGILFATARRRKP